MALKRSGRSADKSNKAQGTRNERKQRRITNTSREANRNEEYISPYGRKGQAARQWNDMSQDLDRSSGRATPPIEKPDLAASEWNKDLKHNQTTGSYVPGTKKNEPLEQTSREHYPTSGKSSPTPVNEIPEEQQVGNMQERTSYTGNSERAGQQYSVEGNSSQAAEKNKKTNHPDHDKNRMVEQDARREAISSNKGMDEQGAEVESSTKGKDEPAEG